MFLFGRKKAEPPTGPQKLPPKVLDGIYYSTDTARKYTVTPEEIVFFEALDTALHAAGKSTYYKATRMANGALSVQNRHAYIGKIKLCGKKTWMQYMAGTYTTKTAEGLPLEEYIDLLKYWVKTA